MSMLNFDDTISDLEWHYNGHNRIYGHRGNVGDPDFDWALIADVYIPRLMVNKEEVGSYRRNAQLIAAAPEMLAALEFYADESNYDNDTLYVSGAEIPNSSHCAVDRGEIARVAIARANGA